MFSRRIGLLSLAAVCVLPMVGAVSARADEPKAKEEKKTGTPTFKQAWTIDLPDDALQIGLADVMGDKKSHLLVLGKDGILTIHDVSGEKPKQVGKIELGKDVTSFVAGSFVPEKPAIVAVDGAYFTRDKGDTYTKHEKKELSPVSGLVVPTKGSEGVLSFALEGDPKEFRFKTEKDTITVASVVAENPEQNREYYQRIQLRFPEVMLAQIPFPEGMKKGGWNMFFPKGETEMTMLTLDAEGNKARLAVFQMTGFMGDPSALKPKWTGEWFKGKFLDINVGVNPKDIKQMGALVLTEAGEGSKKRVATFYTKEDK